MHNPIQDGCRGKLILASQRLNVTEELKFGVEVIPLSGLIQDG